ncbi:hypothetical protein Cni_G17271 [Canna indica]|uniref:Uncharacterized protein n=1 Tax=Canna indica TaxID=4628 RepID=A0AAQ3QGL1_9LILI|nr:hypothetical protein Cni_G17271 [Canna indica]
MGKEEELMEAYWLSPSSESKGEAEKELMEGLNMPPLTWRAGSCGSIGIGVGMKRKVLKKQLSMKETTREAKWENRRRQIFERRHQVILEAPTPELKKETRVDAGGGEGNRKLLGRLRSLTDEDLDELKGCIELGFGFTEEEGGQDLRNTLPALDLYFAVNRQLSDPKLRFSPSPTSTPTATSSPTAICGTPRPRSPAGSSTSSTLESWKICSPGDDPQHVKTRLRHWAQAVACSLRQSC